jgi:hypothetical protein
MRLCDFIGAPVGMLEYVKNKRISHSGGPFLNFLVNLPSPIAAQKKHSSFLVAEKSNRPHRFSTQAGKAYSCFGSHTGRLKLAGKYSVSHT